MSSSLYIVSVFRVADDSLEIEKSFQSHEMDDYEGFVSGLEKDPALYFDIEVKRVAPVGVA